MFIPYTLGTGNTSKAQEYTDAFNVRKEAISNVFWSESAGVWLDYDLDTSGPVNKFFPSNIMPMWASCYDGETATQQKVLDYLKVDHIFKNCNADNNSKDCRKYTLAELQIVASIFSGKATWGILSRNYALNQHPNHNYFIILVIEVQGVLGHPDDVIL